MNAIEQTLIFRHKIDPGAWRIETYDNAGGVEVTIFSGPNAEGRGP